MEAIFWSEAATVHCLKKHSQPCDSQAPASKRLCSQHTVPAFPEPELGQQPAVNSVQLWLNVVLLSLSNAVIVCNSKSKKSAGSSQPPVFLCSRSTLECQQSIRQSVAAKDVWDAIFSHAQHIPPLTAIALRCSAKHPSKTGAYRANPFSVGFVSGSVGGFGGTKQSFCSQLEAIQQQLFLNYNILMPTQAI